MNNIFIILTVSIAVSYGWGMRGFLLGGERGAVLPGALLGMFLAIFSDNQVIADNFVFFAAVGASAMAFGGTEPYAQTMHYVLHHEQNEHNPIKGYTGIFLKGALWHGITGVVLGIAFSAVSGYYYSGTDIIVVLCLIPFTSALGVRIFNKPFDTDNKKFPQIYFSTGSREEWGGNVLNLTILLILTIIRKDWYAFFFALTGILGGGLGFSIGILLYDLECHPMKNGKYFFGKYHKNIDGWKIMEYAFGALAGIFFAVYFIMTKDSMLIPRISGATPGEPIISSPISAYSVQLSYISLALIPLIKIVHLFEDKIDDHIIDLIERPVLYVVPMVLSISGCELCAKFSAFALLVFFAGEKVVFEENRNEKPPLRITLGVIYGLCTVISVLLCIFAEIPLIVYILIYTVYYIISDIVPFRKLHGSVKTVLAYFFVQTIYLVAVVLTAL